jgi:transposase
MLVQRLDMTQPGWRKKLVISMDNSPCHRNPTVHSFIEEKKLPVLFTGPASFDIVASEYLFASIKRKFSVINIEAMDEAWRRDELQVRGAKKKIML